MRRVDAGERLRRWRGHGRILDEMERCCSKEGNIRVDQELEIASVYIKGYGRSRISRECTQLRRSTTTMEWMWSTTLHPLFLFFFFFSFFFDLKEQEHVQKKRKQNICSQNKIGNYGLRRIWATTASDVTVRVLNQYYWWLIIIGKVILIQANWEWYRLVFFCCWWSLPTLWESCSRLLTASAEDSMGR